MKLPKYPTKPYAPYKPQPPARQIEKSTSLGSVSFEEDSGFTLQSFEDFIKSSAPNVDPSSVKFSWEIHKEPTYYDETIVSLMVNLYTTEIIDNPNYDRLYKHYQAQLVKYKEDYAKYKKDLAKYKIADKQYKEDLVLWQLEHAKNVIKQHEAKAKAKKTTKKSVDSKKRNG